MAKKRSSVCHITGLPYRSPNFLNSSVSMGSGIQQWTTTGTVEYWSGRGYQIGKWYMGDVSAGVLYSPIFQLPKQLNISYSSAACYFTTGRFDAETDIYTGVTSSLTKSTSKKNTISRIKTNNNPGASKFTTFSHTISISNGQRISIGFDEQKDGNLADNWITIAYLNIDYAQ